MNTDWFFFILTFLNMQLPWEFQRNNYMLTIRRTYPMILLVVFVNLWICYCSAVENTKTET